jgi:hypothetical protein
MAFVGKVIKVVIMTLVVAIVAVGCGVGPQQATPTSTPSPTDTSAPPTDTPSATPTTPATEATVAVAPVSGPPGSEVQVTAAGFPPETGVELRLGRQGSDEGIFTTRRTGADGTLTAPLAIPTSAGPDREWVVEAETADGEVSAVSNVFQVTAPQYQPEVTVSPTSGPPGTSLRVAAQGFPPDATVEIGLGRDDSEYDVVATAQVNDEGSLTAQLPIPEQAEADERWVVVVTTRDGAVKAISSVVEVTQVAYQGTVAISPMSGPPGTSVEVVARDFPPNVPVEIGVGRVDSEYDVVARVQTDENGRVVARIAMPTFVEPEDRWVIVVAAEQGPVKAVSDEFDVTAPATPSGNLFTRTNIYLIAIGDDGQSGKEIGCDDSVVPVEVSIEPTIAPLTAALQKLLAIDSREYGQVGYYNALYRSNLTLEDVAIRNREAIIRLSGTVSVGGVCDEPRVRAQLEETALQYATVDRVSIFINGTPLDQVLGAVTPTPEGDLFTRAKIYLIAVGDDGQSGKEIGCDDSVVPVEVAIEPTVAPLRAALQELLVIETQEYGQSGLYNALYRSDLALQDVLIQDREAIIRLSGTVSVGGVCDEPRVRAQLEETALQYATVDRVSIFVNGTALEEVLGQG